MSRFITAFPGSDESCCENMVRENVCDPCCVDEFVCSGSVLVPGETITIDDYTDGMFGVVCEECVSPGEITPWDGVMRGHGNNTFGQCQWNIFYFGGPSSGNLGYNDRVIVGGPGAVISPGFSGLMRITDLPTCQAFYLFQLSCTTTTGFCLIYSDTKSADINSVDDTPLGLYDDGLVIV